MVTTATLSPLVLWRGSTNGLSEGQWHALYSWLDIKQADDQKWYPSDLAVAEIKLAMAALAEAPEPF